jgi:hypothetical protein
VFGASLINYLAVMQGKPASTAITAGSVYFPLLLTAIFTLSPFPKPIALMAFVSVSLAITELNRTTMIFIGGVLACFAVYRLIKSPTKGLMMLILITILMALAVSFVPEDSSTYRRIVGLVELDLDRRTGSVGERAAEWDAIQAKLESKGDTVRWLGLGFGGTYEVQFTHEFLTGYGHAHFIWAWFNLRFGYIGYLYMTLFIMALLYNAFRGLISRTDVGLLVGLTCIMGLIFCLTHVNSVFLLSGIHFFYCNKPRLQGYIPPQQGCVPA